jgi:hypothetical protein
MPVIVVECVLSHPFENTGISIWGNRREVDLRALLSVELGSGTSAVLRYVVEALRYVVVGVLDP